MGWVDDLHGQIIGLDTAPLIYFIEENNAYLETIQPFFTRLAHGDFQAVTSTITLLEVLVHPLRAGNQELALHYRSILLNSPNLNVRPITAKLAEQAALLRAKHNLRTPDAIQLATAIDAEATVFLTNDAGFSKLKYLQITLLDDLIQHHG